VIDVLSLLRTLANPRDEPALLTVLASPFVGASLDALVVLWAAARRAGRHPLALVAEPGEALAELEQAERARLERVAAWLGAERTEVEGLGVSELIERALESSGYDLAVLAQPGGARRMANIRKLMRLADEHERGAGPDLAGFLAEAARRAAGSGSRESEAPVESDGLNAVRLMTIHRAKGLEFPVVCVADLGRAPIRWPRLMRVGADGRFGLRLSEPGSGRAVSALADAALADEQLRADQAEERRLFYVAMTRAQDRLILSGAAKLAAIPADRTPIGWIAPAFVPDIAARCEEPGGVSGGVAFRLLRPGDEAHAPVVTAGPAVPVVDRRGAWRVHVPVGRLYATPPTTLSYSALAEHARCGYRFYAERVLGLPPTEGPAGDPEPRARDGLGAAERGTLIHGLLERLDFRRPRLPDADAVVAAAAPLRLAPDDAEAIAGLIADFAAGELCARLGRARSITREQRFAFEIGPPAQGLVTGALDVLARERDGRLLVVDYKSDALSGEAPARLAEERYAIQQTLYALAALRSGAREAEIVLLFLEAPAAPVSTLFTAEDAPALEARLRAHAHGILAGRFPVSESPRRALCAGCPARDGLCSWPRAMTDRARPDTLF
jgi:RecB family exonuclease